MKGVHYILAISVALFLLVRFGGMNILPDIAGGVQVAEDSSETKTALVDARAPYFDLPDFSGTHVTLADFADTPLVIVFWATANSDAADQVKILDDYAANVKPAAKGVKLIAINSQEERSIVASFMRRGGYELQTLVDSRGAVSESYGINSLPTFFFIDRGGLIREVHTGVLSAREIGDKVEGILQ